ncbi:DUF1800 domain-containing protein [Devosia naphthalenivorans]|uniref:DUF1800 domain-containing protein n=1 Tax=Devosia naphthalenivorans TaxID=2082392 RepID=UPI0019622A4A|nr:DUF1800 domain-containing protein [Devosia naphthalenivorans]
MANIENLLPITGTEWTYEFAAHLLERVGFAGTPAEIEGLAAMGPQQAVESLVNYAAIDDSDLPAFEESGFWDDGLLTSTYTRPAATMRAERTGEAMGVKVKRSGTRPLQTVTNRWFYWRRASVLEARRLAFWWTDRMLRTPRPLEEKMTLFWHGHFTSSHEKVRDYRKIQQQLGTLRRGATGNFRDLLLALSRDPAMLLYLDAAENVKGAPNENFGREVMELFTLGVGNYTENDIREAARAFTGWTNNDLEFVIDEAKHDDGEKTFLGRAGRFRGEDILSIILEQKQTAEYIATKLYSFFVRDDVPDGFRERLGALLRDNNYEIAPFLKTIFLSKDFYSTASLGSHIKSPTELIVSSYRRLGVRELPGVPDPYSVGKVLGQILLDPPTVAGWAQGRAWITPGLLFERANFAREVLFPDLMEFKDPNLDPGEQVRKVNRNIRAGMDMTAASMEEGAAPSRSAGIQETFNTRYGSLIGWQEAMRKLKPISRRAAQFNLSEIVSEAGATTTTQAVQVLTRQLLTVPLSATTEEALVRMLDEELGTSLLAEAESYMEHGLRMAAHLIMSAPQYQFA